MKDDELDRLRAELAALDRRVVEVAARRRELALRIGRMKSSMGRETRDYGQERDVIERARGYAAELGLPEATAERLLLELIGSSLEVQESDRVRSFGAGGGRRVLVIGGSGRMGRWLTRFLASQGFECEIADPEPSPGFRHHADWRTVELDHDLVVVAAPLRATARILEQMAQEPPSGVVFDVGSLKSPLRQGLSALRAAGAEVASIHPMFGPDAELLSGRHVILVDLGSQRANEAARELFANTMVSLVEMDIDQHDRVIAYILGLSHALNIAFFNVLADSGETLDRLMQLSSTTFDRQMAVALQVASENPYLYFEIQALNEFGGEPLQALREAASLLERVVASGDEEGFVELMGKGERLSAVGKGGEPPSS